MCDMVFLYPLFNSLYLSYPLLLFFRLLIYMFRKQTKDPISVYYRSPLKDTHMMEKWMNTTTITIPEKIISHLSDWQRRSDLNNYPNCTGSPLNQWRWIIFIWEWSRKWSSIYYIFHLPPMFVCLIGGLIILSYIYICIVILCFADILRSQAVPSTHPTPTTNHSTIYFGAS